MRPPVVPSSTAMISRCARKSKSIWNVRSRSGIGDVVSPRGVTYRVTCQEWFTQGLFASRTLPTICVHRCSVAARPTVPTLDGSWVQSDCFLLAPASARHFVSFGLPYLALLPFTTALVVRLVLGVDGPSERLGRSLSAAFHDWPRLFAIEMIFAL